MHVLVKDGRAAGVRLGDGTTLAADTVLLAPAGASFDQFAGYTDRGEAFGAAVQAATR